MIKLKQNTPSYGDCTAGYAVSLSNEYTVEEFINEVLSFNEWGCITIFNNSKPHHFEYKQDKLTIDIQKEILTLKIKSVNAHGGYSMMDYVIYI